MINKSIIEKLRAIYQSMPKVELPDKGDGWVSQYDFLYAVVNARINYKNLGYEYFNEFLSDSGIFFFWTDFTGDKPTKYIIEKAKPQVHAEQRKSLLRRVHNTSVDLEEVDRVKHRLRLDNNQFIGQFVHQKTGGWFVITDIRNTDFTKIEDKERGIKNLSISFKSVNKVFNQFAYYKFTWVLLETSPIKFGIDLREDVTPVYPKDIVRSLYDGIMRYPAGAAKKIARSLDTLKKQLTQSGKEVFIYELLQNANDYPHHTRIGGASVAVPVEVEFHITKNYLIFQHTGEYFFPKNIAAICDINDGEKADNAEAIGYKGIGFKTVFLDNDYVLLNTDCYSFRFDKSATDVINTPWQILPIWTEHNEIESKIKSIFRQHPNEEYRVKFALQPREKNILTDKSRNDNYIDLFTDVFDSERVILFIPNIKKVSIFWDGQDNPIVREKNNKDWCVSNALIDDIPEEITDKINDALNNPNSLLSDGYEKIPEKYMNFRKTSVKFACKKEGRILKAVEDASLYCYLPAKRADWGFNFLMNTDMVPNGQRDDIEDIELNHVIARIAGKQFFFWIKQLIESGEYDLDSIFSLIPDFDECKKRRVYKTFIEEFQEGFESLIKEEAFVPSINKDGVCSYKCIDELINDMTDMTANGIMSDCDYIKLMELDDYCLPVEELRHSESFKNFLYKHSPSSLDIKLEDILRKCEQEDFQKWLTDFDNNTRFIKHWLDAEELDEFAKKTIFIKYEGELFLASDLYYDFDANCSGISFLRRYIPHLCQRSKNSFEADENWEFFVKRHFQPFSATLMISNYIIPNEDAMALLNELNNSVQFFRYLADKNVDLKKDSVKIPYITEDGDAFLDYTNHHYFYSEEAQSLARESWLGDNIINVLSHAYFDGLEDGTKELLSNLFTRLGFIEFSKESFITTIIDSDENFRLNVNAAIENNYNNNKAFVDYVYESNVQLKENSLKDYVLCCIDVNSNATYLCNDDVRYFDQEAYGKNSTYRENTGHAWLKENVMYALSNTYFESCEQETKKLEAFFRQQFGVKTFTDKSFFMDVIIKNKTEIYNSLVDKATMLTFLEYLKRDAEHIFDDTMSFNNIKDMPLLCYDGTIVKTREANVQYIEYDDDAKVLCEKSWYPKVFVLLAKNYTEDFTQDMRQLFKITKYDVNSLLDSILLSASLKQSVTIIEQNVDFWRWVKANQKYITSFDKFNTLPLLDNHNVLATPSSLYISDSYQQDKIELLVTRYVPTAQFVSSIYLESKSEQEKSDWMKLFKKLGLKSDNKDILFSDILPNLASFEEDSVIGMMTKHLDDIKDVWTEKRSQIIQLRVKTRSGEYKPFDQVVLVNVDEETIVEPFKYITLPNEVDPEILKSNKKLLLLISEEYGNCNLITTKQRWIEVKVKDYLRRFNADNNSIADIHIQFVCEVAKLKSEYEIDDNLRKQIKYLTNSAENTYMYAHELTLRSEYSPTCDFEANGVTELPYLSNAYIFEGNKDNIKSYFKAEGLHQNMVRDDLKYLSNRTFACYFWSYCFSRRLSEYESWIKDGCFNGLVCIPTENSVQKPELLYAPHIVAGYAVRAKVPQWEDKVPCKAIVDTIESRDARELFERLHFCKTLSFEDCLCYLAKFNHKREDETLYLHTVIDWMLSSPDYDGELVDKYRKTPTAMWRNGKGQKKHISELYAIHPDATQERNIFCGDEFVMETSAFPINTDSFVAICDILKIKCLTSNDFVATPIGKNDETAKMVPILRPRLLVLSAIENPDKFQEFYERYNAKLSQYHFVVCEKIDLGCDTIHNDVERIYNDDSHLYYVSSWKHNRTFTKFCSRLKRLIGFDVYDDVCEDVLDGSISVESCIEKYCSSLTYNAKFRTYLQSLDLTINVEMEEENLNTVESEYYSDAVGASVEETNETETENSSATAYEKMNEDVDAIDAANGSAVDKTSYVEQESEINRMGMTTPATKTVQTIRQESTSQSHTPAQSISSEHTVENENVDREDGNSYECDEYEQVNEEYCDIIEDDEVNTTEGESRDHVTVSPNSKSSGEASFASHTHRHDYDPERNDYMGSVNKDKDYQPVGDKPYTSYIRKHPKNYTNEEMERLRSHGTPLELESLPETQEELDLLAQCNIKPEQIADTNYLAQLRLYLNLINEQHEEPAETMEEFVRNADDVTEHKLKDGRYIHTCSAARGVMYIGPTVWNKMVDDKCRICVYLDGKGKNFAWIDTTEKFLDLVKKDDVVIKITGREKEEVVNALYTGLLKDVKGTAYTLIRVASRTNMDAVFAHYVGAMAEVDDRNLDTNEYGD